MAISLNKATLTSNIINSAENATSVETWASTNATAIETYIVPLLAAFNQLKNDYDQLKLDFDQLQSDYDTHQHDVTTAPGTTSTPI